MRQGSPGNNGRRPRGRHHGGGGGGGGSGGGGGGGSGGNPSQMGMNSNRPRTASSLRHQTFDSNGPDVRVRGNAWQVYEKYQSLARDSMGSSDRVAAENYLQHAEHYYRIIGAINEATAIEQQQRGGAPQSYSQQPDMPAGYYPTENGGSMQQQPAGAQPQPDGNMAPPAQMPQAEVRMRNPPPAPSPFFAPEEAEDRNSEPEPLLAQR